MLAGELVERFGPYQEHASMLPYTSGMADFDTALEECEYQGMWFAEVARYMLRERGCSFFYLPLASVRLSQPHPSRGRGSCVSGLRS